jgi:hypothetical protein
MAKIQITGGAFQDAEGNVLANGYLTFELNQDCEVAATGQICSGIVLNVPLDSSGNVSGTVLIWPNDQLSPTNNYYTVTGYTAAGQLAWGPNVQQVLGASPFSLNNWIPNQVSNWSPSPNALTLQTNTVNNGSQTKLNLKSGNNIILTDDGIGDVTVTNLATPGWNFGKPVASGQVYEQIGTSMIQGGQGTTSNTFLTPTATEPATASFIVTQTVQGLYDSFYDQRKLITLGILQDFQMRVMPTGTGNYIIWIGITDANMSPPTPNGIFGNQQPNQNIVGFRFNTAADTTWKAYASSSNVSVTIVDTTVAIDTSASHLFEVRQLTAGTLTYHIDGVQKASISTNLPANSTPMALFTLGMFGVTPTGTTGVNVANWGWTSNK